MAQWPNQPPVYYPAPPPPYYPPQPPTTSRPQAQPAGNHYPHQHPHATPYYPVYQPPPPRPVYMGRPVVGPQYCVGYAVDLVIVRKFWTLTDDFVVRDVNKNVLFRAKGKILTLHDNRLLSDPSGKPVITLRQKVFSMHSRWQVYRGNSSEDRDLVFSAKTSSVLVQFKTKLKVYLAHNTSEKVCDYRVKGSLNKGSCVVYVGESKTNIAAQMKTKDSVQSKVLGKTKFMVTVSPNVDYAFVVGLILILDAIANVADVVKNVVTNTVLPLAIRPS